MLAARNLARLAQHRLRERGQAAQVEPHPALAVELVLDLGGQLAGRDGPRKRPPDVLAEPRLELLGRGRPRGRRYTLPVPGDIDVAQHGLESRVRVGYAHLRQHAVGKAGRRLDVAQPLQVSRQRDHLRLL